MLFLEALMLGTLHRCLSSPGTTMNPFTVKNGGASVRISLLLSCLEPRYDIVLQTFCSLCQSSNCFLIDRPYNNGYCNGYCVQ